MTIRPRWHIAVHEAGHAVVTVALGGTVTQVSVRRAGLTGGRCWSVMHELPPLDQAAVSLAGPCAALFIAEGEPDAEHRNAVIDSGGIRDDQEGDWSHASALAEQHGFSYDDAVERAALLVLDHWPAIQAVARALRGSRRGLVSGDRVTEIVGGRSALRL